jgi:hypothetical protein
MNNTCDVCSKSFKYNWMLVRHLDRKNPCKRAEKKEAENRRKYPKIDENSRENPNDKLKNENTFVGLQQLGHCPYCQKKCKSKNLPYHYRHTCALIPENKRNYFIEKYNNNTRHKNKQNQLQIIKKKNINNNIVINNNTTNNIQNNNITIKINPFGREDLSSLGKKDIFKLINRAYKMIPDTMKAIHYDIPENRNMYIPNVNRPLVKIFNGEEWVYKSLDYVTQMVSDNIKDNLEDWTSKYDKKLSPIKKIALNEFVNKCVEGKMETLFKEELKMFLMTYSNELKDYLNTEVASKLESFENEIDMLE